MSLREFTAIFSVNLFRFASGHQCFSEHFFFCKYLLAIVRKYFLGGQILIHK